MIKALRIVMCLVGLCFSRLRLCALYCAGLCFLLSCGQSELSSPPSIAVLGNEELRIERRKCDYPKHSYVRYRCFWAERLDGLPHRYPITFIEARRESEIESTIISIPGGPGQGNQTGTDWVESWAQWMQLHDLKHRIILYEPFGTYGSNAFFACKEYEKLSIRLVAQALSVDEEMAILAPVIRRCLSSYEDVLIHEFKRKEGLAWLNSEANSHSLSLLINALPFSDVHLLGTSYGTRVALLAARNERVKSLVLDSAYPFSKGTLFDWPGLLGQAFELHERAYSDFLSLQEGAVETRANKSRTNGNFINDSYAELFLQAYHRLQAKPIAWNLERWDAAGTLKFVLTSDRLLALHYHVLYDEELLPLFYTGLQGLESKARELAWVLESFVTNTFDDTFSTLVFIAVECNDNSNVSEIAFMTEASQSADQFTDWPAFYKGDVCHLDFFDNSEPVQDKVYVDKPTIILSGGIDPVTPASWAQTLSSVLSSSELYIRNSKSHGVLTTEECLVPRLNNLWSHDWSTGPAELLSIEEYESLTRECEYQP